MGVIAICFAHDDKTYKKMVLLGREMYLSYHRDAYEPSAISIIHVPTSIRRIIY